MIKCPGCKKKHLLPMSASIKSAKIYCTCGWMWDSQFDSWVNMSDPANWNTVLSR